MYVQKIYFIRKHVNCIHLYYKIKNNTPNRYGSTKLVNKSKNQMREQTSNVHEFRLNTYTYLH